MGPFGAAARGSRCGLATTGDGSGLGGARRRLRAGDSALSSFWSCFCWPLGPWSIRLPIFLASGVVAAPPAPPSPSSRIPVHPSREIVSPWIGREIDYFFYIWMEKTISLLSQ
mgnify:CR=1 FL=1